MRLQLEPLFMPASVGSWPSREAQLTPTSVFFGESCPLEWKFQRRLSTHNGHLELKYQALIPLSVHSPTKDECLECTGKRTFMILDAEWLLPIHMSPS